MNDMAVHTLKDGSTTRDPRLDRLVVFDPQSLQYRIRGALNPTQQQQPVTKTWTVPAGTPVLDQGAEGACVGFAVTNELLFEPVPVPGLDNTFARERIYWTAQRNDPWRGGSYPGANPRYEGTSLLYGVKAAATAGYYRQYRWATSEPEMAAGVSYLGPALIGVDWYDGMEDPDRNGFIHATGNKVGGHCTLLAGIDVERGHYIVHNSWGPRWGTGGRAKLPRADMARLLADQGECCIITARSQPAAAQPAAATTAQPAGAR